MGFAATGWTFTTKVPRIAHMLLAESYRRTYEGRTMHRHTQGCPPHMVRSYASLPRKGARCIRYET